MHDFLTEQAKQRQAEWDSHVREEIHALVRRGNVTWDEYSQLWMNSYERETLFPALTTEALVKVIRVYLQHCQIENRCPASTYDQEVLGVLLPLLLERVEAEANRPKTLEEALAECRKWELSDAELKDLQR